MYVFNVLLSMCYCTIITVLYIYTVIILCVIILLTIVFCIHCYYAKAASFSNKGGTDIVIALLT